MTSTSRLQRTIADYRARLLANEAQAAKTLDAAHQHTLKVIQPRLDALYRQMTDALAEGDQVTVSWLYEANRLEVIKKLITHEIDQFGAMSSGQVGRLQQDGVHLGLDAAMELLKATIPPSVSWSFGVPSHTAIQNLIGVTQAGSPLADLFNGFGREAATKVSKALITGVTLGQNPRVTARTVQDALGISRNRALVISSQESLRCYRSANTATFRANSDVVEKWRWKCDLSPRTCAACLAMDGTLHDVSEDLESHVRCRCVPIPITRSWADILAPLGIDTSDIEENDLSDMQSGSDWLDGQDAATQRSVLGNLYDGWKAGDFTLKDVVQHNHDADWGGSIAVKPLKALVG